MSIKDIGKLMFIHTVKDIRARKNQITFLCITVKKLVANVGSCSIFP